MTDKQRFSSVWDAIEDTPQQAASMRARSELMMNLTKVIRKRLIMAGSWGLLNFKESTYADALFGVTQPRASDLMRGKINLFSLDTLIDMAATAGMSPTVKVSQPKVVKHARPKRGAAPDMVAA
ncbi:MAG: XRE family transcriptional regulator [Polaromonas sp.]|nr:XRE family transcriptional regulator [Polaromonas sp.]